MKKLYIATDHRGYHLKQRVLPRLEGSIDAEIVDVGGYEYNPGDDYPDYAFRLGEMVAADPSTRGVLFCGSGMGMAIAANKIPGIIATDINTVKEAEMDRWEHNSNILVMGADDLNHSVDRVYEIIKAWSAANFAGGRHLRRINKIKMFEKLQKSPYATKPLLVHTVFTTSKDELYQQVAEDRLFAPLLNIDIAESDFVSGETVKKEDVIELLKQYENNYPEAFFTVHLMLRDPQETMKVLNNMKNIYLVYIHHEANITGVLDAEWSFQLGITLNPETRVEEVDVQAYPVVQLMTIEPGAQGREMDITILDKVGELKQNGFSGEIHFDGGINEATLERFLSVNANILYVGSAITEASDRKVAYEKLVNQLRSLHEKNN